MDNLNTFYIRTYGCQMNELDSDILSTQLLNRGLEKAKNEKEADIIIFNTCSIRDLAERKVLGKIGQLSRGKKRQIIGIAGCMVMAKKDKLLQKFDNVDFIIGTNNLSELNSILDELLLTKKQIAKYDTRYEKELENLFAIRDSKIKASVSIIRGCNKFCTYCVVPYTRGREVSRDPKSIVKECIYLRDQGIKEITLLGQNVNSYGRDNKNNYLFHDLLNELDKITGIERIRFMTSHPVDITKELMYAIRDLNKVCEFIHFPVQSGSNSILKKMNRIYSKEEYLEKVNNLKLIVPNATIGTDIIVGFPGETDDDFQQTYNLFNEVQFDLAFIFAYSPRKKTPSYRYNDDVSNEIKQKRLQALMSLYNEILEKKHKRLIGTTQEILVERLNKDHKFLKGRTRRFEKVIFEGEKSLIGTLQNVTIKDFNHQTLIGSL